MAAVATLCLEALNMIWLSESLRILSISGRLIGSLRVLSSFFRVAASFRCFSMVLSMMSTQSSLRAFSSLEYRMSSSLPQDSWNKMFCYSNASSEPSGRCYDSLTLNTPFPTRVATDVVFRGRKRPHSRELDFGNTRLPYNDTDN